MFGHMRMDLKPKRGWKMSSIREGCNLDVRGWSLASVGSDAIKFLLLKQLVIKTRPFYRRINKSMKLHCHFQRKQQHYTQEKMWWNTTRTCDIRHTTCSYIQEVSQRVTVVACCLVMSAVPYFTFSGPTFAQSHRLSHCDLSRHFVPTSVFF